MTAVDSMRLALVVFRSVRRALRFVLEMHGSEVVDHVDEIHEAVNAWRGGAA